jgi:NAD-dependent dihydropyrimidine dehydrogenase PreA subunit
MKYKINESLCTGCGLCVNVCPVRAITLSDAAHIDNDLCTGCGDCINVCQKGAIIEVPDEMVQENVSVPAAIASGVTTAIGSVRDAIKRYTNSSATTGSRRGGMRRSGGRGRSSGRNSGGGSGGGGRGMNKQNKRKR